MAAKCPHGELIHGRFFYAGTAVSFKDEKIPLEFNVTLQIFVERCPICPYEAAIDSFQTNPIAFITCKESNSNNLST